MITQILGFVIQDTGQIPEKEDIMDTELRELLDLANHIFYLGGDPSLILWKIEEKIELG